MTKHNFSNSDLLLHRKATEKDLKQIVGLLAQDELGANREQVSSDLDPRYIKAFHTITDDPHHYLMVVEEKRDTPTPTIVGTCHLTIMPSLTFMGATRMNIEAVRVNPASRNQGIGAWMIHAAIAYGKSKGATLIQLTTNKQRPFITDFYEKMGFEATHDGMKLYVKE
jgi:GNAT superfamily N-acetyltransferase